MRLAICKVPWSGKGTSFRAHRDVTCRDQLTASCSSQTVHRCNHRQWALTNGPHQFCTGLEYVFMEFSVGSCLKHKLMIFLYNEYKEALGKCNFMNQFLQIVSGGKHFSRVRHQ